MQIPQLYTAEEVAAALGTTPNTLGQWRHRGKAPRHVKVNGSIRYTAAAVLEWLREQNPGQLLDDHEELPIAADNAAQTSRKELAA